MANSMLMAILVQLSAPKHGNRGFRFMEAGLGPLRALRPAAFATLDDAARWLGPRLKP